jgi:hypothetical protein
MGQASVQYAKSKKDQQPRDDKPRWNAQERLALKKMRREAKAAGATLDNNGEGGLAPSLVLGAFRRAGWRCENGDCPAPKKNITIDHISGHAQEIKANPEARRRKDLQRGIAAGHVSKPEAIHVLCAACHDRVHDRERAIDDGEKPQPMRGSD